MGEKVRYVGREFVGGINRMYKVLVSSFIVLLCLCASVSCGGPKFTLTNIDELAESSDARLTLAVSDTVFSLSVLRHYQERNPLLLRPEELNRDSAGPMFFLWFRNEGPGALFPISRDGLLVGLKGDAEDNPAVFEILIDGREWTRSMFNSVCGWIVGVRSTESILREPCKHYDELLTFVRAGESLAIPQPIVLCNHVDPECLQPGVYEIAIVLESSCFGETDKPLWKGIARSNRVRFRIAEN